MKKIKFLFLYLISLLSINFCVYSQNNAGVTTCSSKTACPGTVIELTIRIVGSPPITAISLRLDYDGDVLSYITPTGNPLCNPSYVNPVFGNSNNVASNQIDLSGNNRDVTFSWSSATAVTIQTNGTGILFKILFYYYGGTTTLHFNNSSDYGMGDYCEYAGANGLALYDNNPYSTPFYVDGTVSPTSISGYFTYDNGSGTGAALDSLHVNLLKPPYNFPNDTVMSTWTNDSGYYNLSSIDQYSCISSGYDYRIIPTTITWGGVNSTDAVKLAQNYLPYPGNPSFPYNGCMQWLAADVNNDLVVTYDDKDSIMARWAGTLASFSRGNWVFGKKYLTPPTCGGVPGIYDNIISFSGTNVIQDFLGLCVGDVNGDYSVPQGQKSLSSAKVNFSQNNIQYLKSNEYFELPVKVSDSITVSAISLILKYPKNLVEINDVKLVKKIEGYNTTENVVYNINKTGLRIAWIRNNIALKYNENDTILLIKLTTKSGFESGNIIKFEVVNDPLCELADENGEPINNVELKTSSIEFDNSKRASNVSIVEKNFDNSIKINPNPVKDILNIDYKIADNGNLNISIYNVLGQKIIDVINNFQQKGNYNSNVDITNIPSGVYDCKMTLNDKITIVKRFVISK